MGLSGVIWALRSSPRALFLSYSPVSRKGPKLGEGKSMYGADLLSNTGSKDAGLHYFSRESRVPAPFNLSRQARTNKKPSSGSVPPPSLLSNAKSKFADKDER